MRPIVCVLALASCLAIACPPGSRAAPERVVATPTVDDAFRIQFEFMARKDVDGLWAIYSDAMRRSMEEMARNVLKLTPAAFQRQFGFPRSTVEKLGTRDVIRAITQRSKLKQDGLETPKIARRKAQGPVTMVYFVQRGRKCVQRFVQAGPHWKVDAPIDCRSLEPLGTGKAGAGHGPGDGHDHGGGPPGMPGMPGMPPGMPGMPPQPPPPMAP